MLRWQFAVPGEGELADFQEAKAARGEEIEECPATSSLDVLTAWTARNWSRLSRDSQTCVNEWIEANLANKNAVVVSRFARQYLATLAALTKGDAASAVRHELDFLGRLYLAASDDAAGRDSSWYQAPVQATRLDPAETIDAARLLARTDPEWNVVLVLDALVCESVEDVRIELSRHLPMAVPALRSRDVMAASLAVGLFRLRAPEVTVWVHPPERETAARELIAILDAVRQLAPVLSELFSAPFTVAIAWAPRRKADPVTVAGPVETPQSEQSAARGEGNSGRWRAALGRAFRGRGGA